MSGESVYERAREAMSEEYVTPEGRDEIYNALDAGEKAERERDEARALIAAMHEAVLEAELRPPGEWDTLRILDPDGTVRVANRSQASGFYRALRARWESGDIGKCSREFRDARSRAETAEYRVKELEAQLKAYLCPKCGATDYDAHDGYCTKCGTV